MKYRRKNQLIDAMQLDKDNRLLVLRWLGPGAINVIERTWDPVNIHIKTLEEPVEGQTLIPGDYIIKHGATDFEIVPRERFEMDYEKEQTFTPGGRK